MFGLEKKKTKLFKFDLEEELEKDPKRVKEILNQVQERTQELKGLLREGAASKSFEECGVFLQGYGALEKVVNRICHSQIKKKPKHPKKT